MTKRNSSPSSVFPKLVILSGILGVMTVVGLSVHAVQLPQLLSSQAAGKNQSAPPSAKDVDAAQAMMQADRQLTTQQIRQEFQDLAAKKAAKSQPAQAKSQSPIDQTNIIDTPHFKGSFRYLRVKDDTRDYTFDTNYTTLITDDGNFGGPNTGNGIVRLRIGWENDDQTIVNFYSYIHTGQDGWYTISRLIRLDNPNQPRTEYIELLGEVGKSWADEWQSPEFHMSGPMNTWAQSTPPNSTGSIKISDFRFKVGGTVLVPEWDIPVQKYTWGKYSMDASMSDVSMTIGSTVLQPRIPTYPFLDTYYQTFFHQGDYQDELEILYPGQYPEPRVPFVKFYTSADYTQARPWSVRELRAGDSLSVRNSWEWVMYGNPGLTNGYNGRPTYYGDRTWVGTNAEGKTATLTFKNFFLRYATTYVPLTVNYNVVCQKKACAPAPSLTCLKQPLPRTGSVWNCACPVFSCEK